MHTLTAEPEVLSYEQHLSSVFILSRMTVKNPRELYFDWVAVKIPFLISLNAKTAGKAVNQWQDAVAQRSSCIIHINLSVTHNGRKRLVLPPSPQYGIKN